MHSHAYAYGCMRTSTIASEVFQAVLCRSSMRMDCFFLSGISDDRLHAYMHDDKNLQQQGSKQALHLAVDSDDACARRA